MLRGFGPAWEQGCREVSLVSDLGHVPLVVLEAGAPEMPTELSPTVRADLTRDRHELLLRYAALSTNGSLRLVPDTSHAITREKPEVVIACVKERVSALSAGQPNPA